MKKIFFLFLSLFLVLPLVLGVTITTTKTDYVHPEQVIFNIGGCTGNSILQIINPNSGLVDMAQGKDNWQASYNTQSDQMKGKYIVTVSCNNGAAQKNFCVDASSCTITPATSPYCGDGSCNGGETCSSCSSDCGRCPGGHDRSRTCWANWSCSNWNVCGKELVQKRTCYDVAGCEAAVKTESRICTPCDESWSCTIWSGCQYGQQVRKCYDERFCDTFTKKPLEQKACQAVESGFVPSKIIQTSPDQFTPPKKTIPRPTFWDSYGKWLIGILGALIVLGLVIFLYFHFHKKRGGEVTNSDELKSWAEKELDAGKDENRIKEAAKRSGWTEQEVDEAFASIGKK